jgi:hypothetical protein
MTATMMSAKTSVTQTPKGSGNNWVGSFSSMMVLMGDSGALTVWLPESHLAVPRATPIMPRVMINGIMRSPPMANPLSNPIPAPTAIVNAAAAKAELLLTSAVAPTTLVSATTEPTLKSMPALTMIIVIPSVPIATITVWVKMILKFAPVKK